MKVYGVLMAIPGSAGETTGQQRDRMYETLKLVEIIQSDGRVPADVRRMLPVGRTPIASRRTLYDDNLLNAVY